MYHCRLGLSFTAWYKSSFAMCAYMICVWQLWVTLSASIICATFCACVRMFICIWVSVCRRCRSSSPPLIGHKLNHLKFYFYCYFYFFDFYFFLLLLLCYLLLTSKWLLLLLYDHRHHNYRTSSLAHRHTTHRDLEYTLSGKPVSTHAQTCTSMTLIYMHINAHTDTIVDRPMHVSGP